MKTPPGQIPPRTSSRARLDAQCTEDREAGRMSALPNLDQARALAAAVINLALEDLRSQIREERDEARQFLAVGLWLPDVPWAALLELHRDSVTRALRAHLSGADRLDFRTTLPELPEVTP